MLYNTMTGAEGLKNIVLATIIKTTAGITCVAPMVIIDINIIRTTDFKKSKIVFLGIIFWTITIPAIVFLSLTKSRLNEQQYIKDRLDFTDWNISCQCISDLITDDYETFTVNDCYVDSERLLSSSGRGGSNYHYEYTATFYNGKSKITKMQIGSDDTEYLKNLPYGFDTEITVYKKSGFLRSVRPSVDFGREESYKHFFTISVDGDRIIYEKNTNINIENLTWSGFRKNQNYDIHNSLFGINADREKNYLDVSYMDTLCDEICLYGVTDGKYRRLSNILAQN